MLNFAKDKGLLLRIAALAVVYVAAGKGGLQFASIHPSATAVWPPTGIALAALVVLGMRVWPGVLVGAFVVNLTTFGSVLSSLGIAIGNTLEAVTAAWLVTRCAGGVHTFERPQDVFKYTVLAALLSTMISASVGVISLALTGYARWTNAGLVWTTWWLGDAASALVITPLLVLWTTSPLRPFNYRHMLEAGGILVALAAAAALVFAGFRSQATYFPIEFAVLPVLVWAAFRFGPRLSATAVALLAGIALWGTLRGTGPFSWAPSHESVLLLQAFLAVTAVTAMVLAAAVLERQRAVEAQARLAAIVESSDDAILSKTLDGTITSWNRGAERLYGYTAAEAIGTSGATLVPPGQPDDFPAIVRRLRRGERIDPYETVQQAKDARRLDVSMSISPIKGGDGRLVGAAVIARDVSERKRGEAERARLLAQEQWARFQAESITRRLETVLEHIPIGVIMVDAATGRLTANPAARLLAAGGPEYLEAWQDPAMFGPDGQRLRFEDLPAVRALGGETVLACEMTGTRPDGAAATLLVSAAPVLEENGTVSAAVVTLQDITERKSLEQLKDQFLSLAAHELKTPITAIRGNTQLLLRQLRKGQRHDERQLRLLETIEERTTYVAGLINELLDLSRIETGRLDLHLSPVDLAQLLTGVIALQRELHPATPFSLRGATAPIVGHWDRERLDQVFTNLLDNAVKYSPAGEPVTVTLAADAERVQVTVQDHGIGVPATDLPHLFERHFRGSNVHQAAAGLGLGLYLAGEIVRRHGGTIYVESVEGHGATFTVTLPRHGAPAEGPV